MTNEQLYVAMAVPLLFNAIGFILIITLLGRNIDMLGASLNKRIDDSNAAFRELMRAELGALRSELRGEMAKNHSELLAKFAELDRLKADR